MEYSDEYVKELEAKLWEMISLKKAADGNEYNKSAIMDNLLDCIDEAEKYLNK